MKVITINSFRGGTGKSTVVSNLATHLASFGLKVMIIDADIVSPGIHAIFGLVDFPETLTDYLAGRAKITDIVYDISGNFGMDDETLFIVPSSISEREIAGFLQKKNLEKFTKNLDRFKKDFDIDYILIDTHPGITEEVLIAYGASDAILNIVRPDNQDYQGLRVSKKIASKLKIDTYVVMNKVHQKLRTMKLKKQVEKDFGVKVVAMFPESEDITLSQSRYVFTQENPDHDFSRELHRMAEKLFGVKPRKHLDLMKHMLDVIKDEGPASYKELAKGKVENRQNVNWYLQNLIKRKFVSLNQDKYKITSKGNNFLANFSKISRFVESFGL